MLQQMGLKTVHQRFRARSVLGTYQQPIPGIFLAQVLLLDHHQSQLQSYFRYKTSIQIIRSQSLFTFQHTSLVLNSHQKPIFWAQDPFLDKIGRQSHAQLTVLHTAIEGQIQKLEKIKDLNKFMYPFFAKSMIGW